MIEESCGQFPSSEECYIELSKLLDDPIGCKQSLPIVRSLLDNGNLISELKSCAREDPSIDARPIICKHVCDMIEKSSFYEFDPAESEIRDKIYNLCKANLHESVNEELDRIKELAGLTEDHWGSSIGDYERISTELVNFINTMSNCLENDKLFYAEKEYQESLSHKNSTIAKAKSGLAKNVINVIKRNRHDT